ncbi:MAG: GNAT family N-acetyltransferase/peptidase C39 family protein [Candidatus Competibacterales bacterium]|nr:GNAT family N-acetyltransferase/peptidase C39 family protein [Candidatus Competibacterales bacterium]
MSLADPAPVRAGTTLRAATLDDLDALVALEERCFSGDRLSRRSFRHLLTRGHAALQVADTRADLAGYVLLLFSRGTSMARLYSIAVDPGWRRHGLARALVDAAEQIALAHDCVSLRLEIRRDNSASQALFRTLGYRPFRTVPDYYEDHMDALRFEKRLLPQLPVDLARVPYYHQTLEFTCGPAALMMAMHSLDPSLVPDRKLELRLWREATTIFMTAGHGGCSPYGLAIAAYQRGFAVELHVNERGTFLVDSVRSPEKKTVMTLVQEDMLDELRRLPIALYHGSLGVDALQAAFEQGGMPVVLVSSYRIYRERSPHWVVITGFDARYVYTHDPYIDHDEGETVTDSINMPIPRRDFQRMARYGRAGQKAVLILRRRDA